MRKIIYILVLLLSLWLLTRNQEAQKEGGNSTKIESFKRLPAIGAILFDSYMDSMAERHNIPIEVIEGIAWNESHWGQSALAQKSNNLFGIKCGDNWQGERCGKYRKYGDRNESVADFCEYIKKYYSHLIGKPLSQWRIKGYAVKTYTF
jgi:hypothetical protein